MCLPRSTMQTSRRFSRSVRPSRGVTLIELMIVVAIVAILAAVGFPAYTEHVRKGNRAQAQTYMLDIASRQGEILADSHTYAAQTEMFTLLPVPEAVNKHYAMTVTTSAAPPKFTVTATAKTTGKQMADGNLGLDDSGKKTPADKW